MPLNSTFTLVKFSEEKNTKKSKKKNEKILPKEQRETMGFKEAQLFDVKKGP